MDPEQMCEPDFNVLDHFKFMHEGVELADLSTVNEDDCVFIRHFETEAKL